MLVSLHVKNLALIQEAELSPEEGLNVLTGETGAGKSILVGSINLALGAKADKDSIRKGEEYALVELQFISEKKQVKAKMEELDLPMEEDGSILLTRKIGQIKNVLKVNGETVTLKQARELAEVLLDLHGQHEHQSLLKKTKHREILDAFAGEELEKELEGLKEPLKEVRRLTEELEKASVDEAERLRNLELAQFEAAEIEGAALSEGEDELLEKRFQLMSHGRKMMESLGTTHGLTGYEDSESAGSKLGMAVRELRSIAGFDETAESLTGQLEEIENLLNDFNRELSDYMSDLEFDESEFAETQERLNTINHLKAKYGKSMDEILSCLEERKKTINRLQNYDLYKENLKTALEKERKILLESCGRISTLRKKAAKELEKKLVQSLTDLNFLHVRFQVLVESDEEKITGFGYDNVEFLISTNPGEEVRPLQETASGGELSRIMLALKTVLADQDSIETLIFDEIDTGISGKTAWKVSEKLGELGKTRQVLCITHLPQIAAMGDTHFYIEKETDGKTTHTTISPLSEQEREKELARMLGGDENSPAALENARELLHKARG